MSKALEQSRSEPEYDERYVRAFDERDCSPGTEDSLFGYLYRKRLLATCVAVREAAKGSRVVDLGCAQGNVALALAENGYRVTGVEINQEFLSYAAKKDAGNLVEWVCSDIRALHRPSAYDVVIMTEVLEHTGAPEGLVDAAADLLKDGGLLVVSTPNADRLRQPLPTFAKWAAAHPDRSSADYFGPAGEHHRYLFTRVELRMLVRNAFAETRVKPITSAVVNASTARMLKSRSGRPLITTFERASLLFGLDVRFANEWLATAHKRPTKPRQP